MLTITNWSALAFDHCWKKVSKVEIVCDVGDGREAIRLVEEHAPDVVLTDIATPTILR